MKARIKANGVQLYGSHTYMSPIVGQLAKGTEVELEGEYGCWVKVKDKGWVKAAHTEAIDLSVEGGGGVSSWDDLTDKPFGEEKVKGDIILPDWAYEPKDEYPHGERAPMSGDYWIGRYWGSSLTCLFDGEAFAVQCKHLFDNSGAGYFGNSALIEDFHDGDYRGEPVIEDTGEPFCVYDDGGSNLWFWFADKGSHSIELYTEKTAAVPLDPKYLPDSVKGDVVFSRKVDGDSSFDEIGVNSADCSHTFEEIMTLLEQKALTSVKMVTYPGRTNPVFELNTSVTVYPYGKPESGSEHAESLLGYGLYYSEILAKTEYIRFACDGFEVFQISPSGVSTSYSSE